VSVGKRVAWTEPAKGDLRAIDQVAALRILRTMARYLATGEGDVKRLKDIEPPEFRLRVGDYRVRFHDLGDSVLVLAVKHRRDAYR
jgi:mRNA-degrading endonuclease RelE of RelBE toxin-antitoxin system